MKKLRIIFSVILVLFVTAPYCYGSTISMESDQISVDVPNGWDLITSDGFSEEAGKYYKLTEDEWPEFFAETNKVLLGVKSFKDSDGTVRQGAIELSYNQDTEGQENYDGYGEDDIKDFYADYGEEVISTVFFDSEEPEALGEPQVINGKLGSFIQIDVSDMKGSKTGNSHRLYYTVRDGVIINFVLTGPGNHLLKSQIKDAETMVASFEDTGYYDDYIAESDDDIDEDYDEEYDEEEYDGDSDIGSLIIIPIIGVIIAIGAAFIKKSGEQGKTVSKAEDSTRETAHASERKPQQRPAATEETVPKGKLPKFQPTKADGKNVLVHSEAGSRKARSPEESYIDSLKTLLDSGLLTKEEYQEMVEKHNRRRL